MATELKDKTPTLEELVLLVRYWRTHVNPACHYCADQLERLYSDHPRLPKPLPTKDELAKKMVFLDKK